MKKISKFDKEIRSVVQPIFENGCYWIHSENILLAFLSDSRQEIRKKGIAEILNIRHNEEVKLARDKEQNAFKKQKKCSFKRERVFIKPLPNYLADDYPDIISTFL